MDEPFEPLKAYLESLDARIGALESAVAEPVEPTPTEPEPEPAEPEEPAPEPEPTPTAVALQLGRDPHENLRLLQQVAVPKVEISSAGPAPLADTWVIQHSVTEVTFREGSGLSVEGGKPTLIREGRGNDPVALSPVSPGATVIFVPSLSGEWEVGDWLFVFGDDPIDAAGKYREGWLRQIVDLDQQSVTLDRPVHTAMGTNPRAAKIELAPPVTVTGGKLMHTKPELDYFDPVLLFNGCLTPTLVDVEVASGGSDGIMAALCVDLLFNVHVHDLIDDEGGTGWRREAAPDVVVANPNGKRHYGYGVTLAQATRGGLVTGDIHHCRHAFTTNSVPGGYRLHPQFRPNAGNPEGFAFAANVHDCWSSNISPHECGWDGTFGPMRSTDAGLLQNRYGSLNGKENPDHFANRMRHAKLHQVTISVTRPGGRSVGLSTQHRLIDGEGPTTVVDGVTMQGGLRKAADTRAPVEVAGEGLCVDGSQTGLHVQASHWRTLDGAQVEFRNVDGYDIIFSSSEQSHIDATSDQEKVTGSGGNVTWRSGSD